jgi:hypothetical protein
LEDSSDVLLDIRSRFLPHVKRDNGFLDFKHTHDDQGAIDSGNRVAHNPDPVNDSRLYLEGKRQDEGTFEYLYGHHHSVCTLSVGVWSLSVFYKSLI